MKLLITIAFLVSPMCWTPTATGRCFIQPLSDAVRGAKVIFVGKVTSISDPTFPAPPLEAKVLDLVRPVTVQFTVERVYRGNQVSQIEVSTRTGGLEWGYEFTVGEKYLVYAQANHNGGLVVVPCGRTRPASQAAEDLRLLTAPLPVELAQDPLGPKPKKARTLEDYVPSTLKEIDTANLDSGTSGTIHPFKVRATYGGTSRQTSQNSMKALVRWTQCCAGNPDHYLKSYDTEILFKADGTDYWLPVNKQLLAELRRKFGAGEPIDLYLIRLATESENGNRSWALLVEKITDVIEDKNEAWKDLQNKTLTKFSWGCASTATYPTRRLNRIVKQTMKREGFSGFGTWGDRAFAFDLNGDHQSEYFVPLDCGGTGNCVWGLFAMNPVRRLGLLTGQDFYVYSGVGRWPAIITYGHLSAIEGSLTTYGFRRQQYLQVGARYPINLGELDLEIQGGQGNRMPNFLEKARPACSIGG